MSERNEMKPRTGLLFALLLAGSFILQPQFEAEAQVFVGASGSINDVGGATFGIGARVGVVLHSSPEITVAMEGVGEYLFPPCDVVDCDAISIQGNIIARRQVASYAEAYAGLGVVYQDFTLEDGELKHEGDDLGFSILVGTQSGQPGGIRPFLEVRFSFMDELENQAGAALGIRLPVG